MGGLLPSDMSHHGTYQSNSYTHSPEEVEDGVRWYFTRNEIEENSLSKRDAIDLKKESYLRKSYCTFLQDLGMRLKVPQVTIATAIIFCHRFFLRQSHAKNDRRIIATVCMFLAGKVEETPRPLKDVILVSYEIINKKDPSAAQRIKQKEIYEQQKELVLIGERVVLGTLGFDLNVHHPYKPLVEAIKKFKVAQNALAQVAWNFVNDGLRTSLCLQFKPHHIAAGAIFLAAKFLKVKLPSDGEKVWWQEFDVTPRQLEEVSNQMLELYEQNRVPISGDVEGTAGGSTTQLDSSKALTHNDGNATTNSNLLVGGKTVRHESKGVSSRPLVEATAGNRDGHLATVHSRSSDCATSVMREQLSSYKGNDQDTADTTGFQSGISLESNFERTETLEGDTKDRISGQNHDHNESSFSLPPPEGIKKIDRDKVKAALEKRKKASSQVTRKAELLNEDDLIERELEDGIELAAESKQDRRQSRSISVEKLDYEDSYHGGHEDFGVTVAKNQSLKGQSSHGPDLSVVEKGEVSMLDDIGFRNQSSKSSNRKRKATSSPDKVIGGKHLHAYVPGSQHCNRVDYVENRSKAGRLGHTERDSKRHVQENRV